MAQTTISHLFPSYDEAVLAVADLQTAGVPAADIDVIESEADARLPAEVTADAAQPPAVAGATIGGSLGGGIGALIGIGSISVPFLDPVVRTGWLLPTVIGVVVGGVIGAVVGMVLKLGVTSQQAHSVAEGLQRGQCLVMVRIDDTLAAQAQAMLRDVRAVPTALQQPATAPGEALADWERAATADQTLATHEGQRVRYP